MRADVAVIGAGLSGLMAARTLQQAGLEVTVFDKGRRPGGRANTREHGDYRFDHGAQYFTIRDPSLESHLDDWLAQGVVAPWEGSLVRLTGGATEAATTVRRFVGVPGMVDFALHLAGPLQVRSGVRVETMRRAEGLWHLSDAAGEPLGAYAHVIVAVPAPQAAPLLSALPHLREKAAGVEMAPCWAALFVFAEPPPFDFDGAFVTDGPISWLARDSSKPGRPEADAWVVHATPTWTRTHESATRDEIPRLLAKELGHRFGTLPPIVFQRGHRWGYALADEGVPVSLLLDEVAGVGVCGDWSVGGRVEGALLSGLRTAAGLMRSL